MTSSRAPRTSRSRRFYRLHVLTLILVASGIAGSQALAAPESGVIRAGQADIQVEGNLTLIRQASDRAIIDWRGFSTAAGEAVRFDQPTTSSATLNRVTGGQVSLLLGRLDANGQVFLINPNGIVFGKGAQINVGALVASTANIDNQDFMAGHLAFSEPGQPGAAIINAGDITATEGGLVALVAPQVRNDGIITARLGRVVLAAGDTFTLDLFGDQLINLAMRDARVGQLIDANGQPVVPHIAQSGAIDAAGGQVVLVTAATGKSVLDEVVNLSGVVRADAVSQQGGEILLLGQGGTVNVSGSLSAAGNLAGQQGGAIEVLGDQVNLAFGARLDASGQAGGGSIHVGGAWQGQADTYRAREVRVESGAALAADAVAQGDGGEVVVWADGNTGYYGAITARGGVLGGNGGRVEVSGKQQLDFQGEVDAGASYGLAGSLLLDPAYLNIGLSEASLINRVLRTGTSTSLQADVNINVNAMIDGRGLYAGGGLTMTAGNDININNYVVTNNGTVRLMAGSDINIASGYGVFTGSGRLYATSGNTLANTGLVSASLLHLASTGGDVNIATGIDDFIGDVILDAAGDVNINEPVVNLKNGSQFTATAGGSINVNAQIDGSGGTSGGCVDLSATTGNVCIDEHVVTNNGSITVTAGASVLQTAAGLDIYGAPMTKQLRAGDSSISVTSANTLSLGSLVTTGSINVESTAGDVDIDVPIYEIVGNATVTAAGDIHINEVVANNTSGGDLAMTAGGDIVVDAKVGPWDRTTGETVNRNALPGGSIALTAGGDIDINTDIASYRGGLDGADDASIRLVSTGGSIDLAAGIKVMSDSGLIYVSSHDSLQNAYAPAGVNDPVSMGYLTTGPLTLISTDGNIDINQTIPDTTGAVTITAGNAINVNQRIYSNNADITLMAGLGGITMSSIMDPLDGQDGTYYLSDIDARTGDIWIEAVGDILLAGIRSSGNVTVKSSAGTLDGGGLQNILASRDDFGSPARLDLAGANGIVSFTAGRSSNIHAIATNGSVDGLTVMSPFILEVIAGQDIMMSGLLGSNVELFAGRDILSARGWPFVGNMTAKVGRSITVGEFISQTRTHTGDLGPDTDFSIVAECVNLSAGSNPFAGLSSIIAGVSAPNWTNQGTGDITASANLWLEGIDGMVASATGSITLPAAVHVSDSMEFIDDDPGSITHRQQPFNLSAGDSITLGQIETTGPMSLEAATGNITVNATIGAHVETVSPANGSVWNPDDLGVASLNMSAGGNIDMHEARASRDITNGITGNINITAPNGQVTLIGGTGIQVDAGATRSVDDADGVTVTDIINAATVARLPRPLLVPPAISVGPTIAGPTAPNVPGALPPGAPGAASVAGIAAPDSSGDMLAEIFVAEPAKQLATQDGSTAGTEASDEEQALASSLAADGTSGSTLNPLAFDTTTGAFLVFAGGRGDIPEEERRR